MVGNILVHKNKICQKNTEFLTDPKVLTAAPSLTFQYWWPSDWLARHILRICTFKSFKKLRSGRSNFLKFLCPQL